MQGVGFRWFVRERARGLGIAGWVRNADDGSVELQATGPEIELSEFVASVRAGPPAALVRRVVELNVEVVADLPFPFTVLR